MFAVGDIVVRTMAHAYGPSAGDIGIVIAVFGTWLTVEYDGINAQVTTLQSRNMPIDDAPDHIKTKAVALKLSRAAARI